MTDADIVAAVREAVRQELEPIRRQIEAVWAVQEESPLTIAEAARRMGVCRRTIERRLRDGTMRSVEIKGTRRVLMDRP